MIKSLAAGVAVTVLAAVIGGAHGWFAPGRLLNQDAGKEVETPAAAKPEQKSPNVRDLKPIVTNLAGPAGAWVRLEASVLFQTALDAREDKLVAEIADDTTAFLRTLSAAQLEGARGLRNLRDDLSERLDVRTGGRARGVLIQTLVVQ